MICSLHSDHSICRGKIEWRNRFWPIKVLETNKKKKTIELADWLHHITAWMFNEKIYEPIRNNNPSAAQHRKGERSRCRELESNRNICFKFGASKLIILQWKRCTVCHSHCRSCHTPTSQRRCLLLDLFYFNFVIQLSATRNSP